MSIPDIHKLILQRELISQPENRESLKGDMTKILRSISPFTVSHAEAVGETIITGLEKLGWHGVKE